MDVATPPVSDVSTPSPLLDPLLASVPTVEGHKLLGQTVLLEPIGSGGMGVVYRGWHMTFRMVVAVKVLKPELAGDRDYVRRFRQEAHTALRITHQNVVRVYDLGEQGDVSFLVMEWVDGESSRQRVRRLGRLPVPDALAAFAGAANGLAEAHLHGLVHGDVKPSNLLIARAGRVKVADLGLVQPMEDDEAAPGGRRAVLGTPQYLAPELWDGAAPRPAADLWALGATLYHLVTGRHGLPKLPKDELRRLVRDEPFPTVGSVLASVPGLDDVVARGVERDPARRFADAGELVRALGVLGVPDETLLRDPTWAPGGDPQGLPANEVLGRIDERLRRWRRRPL